MYIPEFLKIGNPVWCGFAGWIEDIAIGTDAIMVKVESPKRKLFNQKEEWLPYVEGVMRPLEYSDFVQDTQKNEQRLALITEGFNIASSMLKAKMSND